MREGGSRKSESARKRATGVGRECKSKVRGGQRAIGSEERKKREKEQSEGREWRREYFSSFY